MSISATPELCARTFTLRNRGPSRATVGDHERASTRAYVRGDLRVPGRVRWRLHSQAGNCSRDGDTCDGEHRAMSSDRSQRPDAAWRATEPGRSRQWRPLDRDPAGRQGRRRSRVRSPRRLDANQVSLVGQPASGRGPQDLGFECPSAGDAGSGSDQSGTHSRPPLLGERHRLPDRGLLARDGKRRPRQVDVRGVRPQGQPPRGEQARETVMTACRHRPSVTSAPVSAQ